MEDSFKVRVDKAFGSLQSSSLNTLWSLTDEEIERNKWIQQKPDPHKETREQQFNTQGRVSEPSSSSRQNMEADIQELEDDDDDEEGEDDDDDDGNRGARVSSVKPGDEGDEEWEGIRFSVGMDCTLDNEEEEDAYDKVAAGVESADRFYMKEVNDYEVDIDSNNELPSSFTDAIRDPRANHMAAKLRLKEDDDSARKSGLQIPENNNIQKSNQTATESKEHETKESKVATVLLQNSSSVPDYVRNPSKYTHYTFDSLDGVDEESNRKAYMDLFNSLKRSDDMEIQDDVSNNSATSIIFTPKKKSSDVSMKISDADGYEDKKVVPISIADDEDSMMDEDEPEMATNRSSSLQKSGRRYRTKGSSSLE